MDDLFSVAFYNVENLFDTRDHPHFYDEDFTNTGIKNWTKERYENKLLKLSKIIPKIGSDETGNCPAIVGLAEVENFKVLKDLVNQEAMQAFNYGIVHFESKDERGIDTALIYDKNRVKIIKSKTITSEIREKDGDIDFTRDILQVEIDISGENFNVFVVHLPSKRMDDVNLPKRKILLQKLREEIDVLFKVGQEKILILGDFNENPTRDYFKSILKTNHSVEMSDNELYNPFHIMFGKGKGTLVRHKQWLMYDQILMSQALVEKLKKSEVFEAGFLKEWTGRYAGNPFRTFAGKKYLGGYSDHLPVYCIFSD